MGSIESWFVVHITMIIPSNPLSLYRKLTANPDHLLSPFLDFLIIASFFGRMKTEHQKINVNIKDIRCPNHQNGVQTNFTSPAACQKSFFFILSCLDENQRAFKCLLVNKEFQQSRKKFFFTALQRRWLDKFRQTFIFFSFVRGGRLG